MISVRDVIRDAVVPPEVEERIERLTFHARRLAEAVDAVRTGRHVLGCDGFTGEYLFCRCYAEIANGAASGDDVDVDDELRMPIVSDGGGRTFYRLGDMLHLRCLQCRSPFLFTDWGMGVRCECWTKDRPRGLPADTPWPPDHGLEYVVEEAQVVLRWRTVPRPE